MNNNNNEPQTAVEADVRDVNRISKIWLIPVVALGIGLWMVYYQWANQGPEITIEFSSATGIEPDKTKIKTRDVDIGIVKRVELNSDRPSVTVTARIDPSAAHLLNDNSKFWVVTPRISLSGVSGLSTLLSGPYIALETEPGETEKYDFVALEEPPVTPAGTPGLHITLNSNDEFAFKEGDPIIYKGLKVGEFEDIFFNLEERVVYYNAFIEAPYHKLITENTKFWNTSGIKFELDTSGIEVQTGSLETVLTNGVTFGVPEGMPAGRQITKRAFFDIFANYDAAADEKYKLGVNFIILIDETVRGLEVGAPVEYRGLVVGEVLEINPPGPLNAGLLDEAFPIPVIITIQPSRVRQPDNRKGMESVRNQTLHWIKKGFRASLKMGNLLTGALYVDLQHYPDALELAVVETFLGYDVIPTRSNEFAQITQKITALLDTINALPLNQIGDNTNSVLAELNQTIQTFQNVASTLDGVISDVDGTSLNRNINKTLQSMNALLRDYADGSESHAELVRSMRSFQQTLQQLTPLLEKLNQAPNSLIFADSVAPQREPKAAGNQEEQP